MRISSLLVVFSLLFVTACATSSSKGSEQLPEPQPMASSQTFTGVWYSPQFEHMYLRQVGDQVRGIYTFKSGGRIAGTVQGNLLVFDWQEPGDRTQARRTVQGKGYLQLTGTSDGVRLNGKWGYDDNYTGGGPWRASYVRELTSDDPETLKEWRDGGMQGG